MIATSRTPLCLFDTVVSSMSVSVSVSALLAGSACRVPERATPPERPGGGRALQAALPCPAPGLLSSFVARPRCRSRPLFQVSCQLDQPAGTFIHVFDIPNFFDFLSAPHRRAPRYGIAPERHAPRLRPDHSGAGPVRYGGACRFGALRNDHLSIRSVPDRRARRLDQRLDQRNGETS